MATNRLECLERMLNKTTLSTRKVTHNKIIDVGNSVLRRTYIDVDALKEEAAKMAVEEAEIRHREEVEVLVAKVKQKAKKEQELALIRMKLFYSEQAKSVAEQRDKAEAERIRQTRKQLEQDKQEALQQQKEKMTAETERTIRKAIEESEKKLRKEFVLERENAVAKALAKARECFNERERKTILQTKQKCEAEAAEIAAKVEKAHKKEMGELQNRFSQVSDTLHRISSEKAELESEFLTLQEEFMRFINHTHNGKFNADYLIQPKTFSASTKNHPLPVSLEEVKNTVLKKL